MDNNKKWYYKFEGSKQVNNEDGTSVKETFNFAILKPNRKMREDGELFFASETSRFAKAGVLPKAAWNTILANGGGTISEDQREVYGGLLNEFRDKSFELQSLLIKTDGERGEEEKSRLTQLSLEMEEIRKKIQSFESQQINIFENTAEAKARNRAILWWVTNLAYREVDGNYVLLFDEETFEKKLDKYDEIEQADDGGFMMGILRKITYLVTLWFLGRVEKEEDFAEFSLALQAETK
jgi:hypothetical protein